MLNKRASILFSPAEYAQLKEKANEKNTTVSELIRTAVKLLYLKQYKNKKQKLAKNLTSMSLPVNDWSAMKKEIIKSKIK